jgi:hypothetical protein
MRRYQFLIVFAALLAALAALSGVRTCGVALDN